MSPAAIIIGAGHNKAGTLTWKRPRENYGHIRYNIEVHTMGQAWARYMLTSIGYHGLGGGRLQRGEERILETGEKKTADDRVQGRQRGKSIEKTGIWIRLGEIDREEK